MRIAFLLFEYFPYGGLQRDCLNIAHACRVRGHEVDLVTRRWEGERPAEFRLHVTGQRGASNVARNRYFFQAWQAIRERVSYDGIVGFNKLPGLDIYYAADPCFVAKYPEWYQGWRHLSGRYREYRRMEAAVFRPEHGVEFLVLTPREIPWYERYYGARPARFHDLPPPVFRRDYEPSARRQAREKLRTGAGGESEVVALFVATKFKTKGLDRVLRGLARLADSQGLRPLLWVVGGDRSEPYQRMAQRLGIESQVKFLGAQDAVEERMLAADYLIHPPYTENTGTVLLEALICGLPVLTTANCGFAHHIETAKAGCVVADPFREAAWDEGLSQISDEHKWDDWSRAAFQYAQRDELYRCHERAAEQIETLLLKRQGQTKDEESGGGR